MPLESAARRRKENAAAGRRKARRPASWAGHLRRSGDRSARETDHRVRRSAPAPVGALLPSFFRGREKDEGPPAPSEKPGGGALAWRDRDAREVERQSGEGTACSLSP